MGSKKAKRVTISISLKLKDALDSIKHTGQSYDGVIRELFDFWEKEHGVEETGRGLPSGEKGEGG